MANSGPPNSDYSPPIHGGFPDPEAEAPYEEGFPLPEAPSDPHLVPGLGKDALPHYLTFSQITNWANRTYRWGHDEALRMNRANALAIRRDPVVMDALRTRQIPLVQLPGHVECQNSQDQRQAEGAAFIQARIEEIPQFQRLKMHLAEALWYGRYGVQLEYQWDWVEGQRCLKVRGFKPINGDKIIFKFSGQAGVLVHATFPGTWQTTEMGRAHFFTPREREQVIIHRHEPEDADFFEPELAGSLQGVGIRGRIYWLWYLRSQVTAFLMDYLERVGAGGLTLYYYEAGNIQSLTEVKTAAETQWRNNALLFPRYRDGTSGGPGVEQLQSSQAGAELLRSLITEYYDDTIRRFILGQSQASEAAGAGLGSGISEFLEGNLGRYIKYDAVNLQETLTTDLVHVLQKYSPYADCPPFRYLFDVDKPNSGEIVSAAQTFYEMGGAIDEDSLREIVGLEKPQEGHSILSKMGNLSPQVVGMAPEGVPMAGTPGPAPQPPQGEISQPGANGTPQGPIQQARTGHRVRMQKRGHLDVKVDWIDPEKPELKTIHINPSTREIVRLLSESELGMGKGLIDPSGEGNHYFWVDDDPAVHHEDARGIIGEEAKGHVRANHYYFGKALHIRDDDGGWYKLSPENRIVKGEGPVQYKRKAAPELGGMIGKQRLRVWNPPQKTRLTLQKLGQKIKMARMSRKKKPRAWNPFPYIRAIRQHFSQHVDRTEIDRAIVNLADQALQGDKHSLLILGDALQDSHEPEWFQTIMDHNLAWPPWQGTGLRNAHKRPDLMRHIEVGNSPASPPGHYEAYPVYNGGSHYWQAGMRVEGRPESKLVKNNQKLTPQETSLLSSPFNADVQLMGQIASPPIKMTPIDNNYHLISGASARQLAGGSYNRYRKGRDIRVSHGGKDYWLTRTMYRGKVHHALSEIRGPYTGPFPMDVR